MSVQKDDSAGDVIDGDPETVDGIVPVFKRGQFVRFKSEKVAEMRKIDKIPNAIGPFPFGKLLITYCDGKCGNDLLYNYEYGIGGNYEGFAVGKDLEPYI